MLDQKKRTVRFETSSLLPLKLVLIEAEKELPARTPKEQQDVQDVNEELALKLTAEMRMSLRAFGKQSPSQYRRYLHHTQAQVLLRRQRAAARNDIQLEP